MLGLFLPKIPGFENMNGSIFDTFTDSPFWDHFWPLASVNRLENCQTIVPTYRDNNDSLIQVLMTHKLLLKLYEFYRPTLYVFITC